MSRSLDSGIKKLVNVSTVFSGDVRKKIKKYAQDDFEPAIDVFNRQYEKMIKYQKKYGKVSKRDVNLLTRFYIATIEDIFQGEIYKVTRGMENSKKGESPDGVEYNLMRPDTYFDEDAIEVANKKVKKYAKDYNFNPF